MKDDFERFGYYLEGSAGSARQEGVFRVNCIDCLDRTNVVQGVLARKHLEALLTRVGLLALGGTLPNAFPQARHLLQSPRFCT